MNHREYIDAIDKKRCELRALRTIGDTLPAQTTDTAFSMRMRFQQADEALTRLVTELKDDWQTAFVRCTNCGATMEEKTDGWWSCPACQARRQP